MKKQVEPKTYSVKMLRGAVGEDGKNIKAGTTITCNRNLAKILSSTQRGEIVERAEK